MGAASQFVTCLVRVPEAYSIVRAFETVRPGFLILAPDGTKWGSVALSADEPEVSGREAAAYLIRILRATSPLPDQHPYPEADPSLLEGTLVVHQVMKGSNAESVGFCEGDLLLRINHRPIEKFFDFNPADLRGKEGVRTVFTVSRGEEIFNITVVGRLEGLTWGFLGSPVKRAKNDEHSLDDPRGSR